MPDSVIRGGQVCLAAGRQEQVDVRIRDGRVAEVGPDLAPAADELVVDAGGLLVLPGLIDCHTHLGISRGHMHSRDDFTIGSGSAAAGGVTTYLNFAPQEAGESLLEALRRHRAEIDGHSLVDYGIHLSFGTPSESWAQELEALVDEGVTSVKVYTTYRDSDYYTRDHHWLALMREARALGITVMVHAENDDIVAGRTRELLSEGKRSFAWHGESRPAVAELEGVARGLVFSHETGCQIYFVHLTNPDSVRLVAEARKRGIPAYAETCPHYVSLDSDNYRGEEAARYVMTPPLRSRDLVERLTEWVARGAVDTVGSDHCGYGLDQRGDSKDFSASSPGIPGVETLWRVVYTEMVVRRGMPLTEAVALVTEHPARIFGLDHKGALAPGMDADVVLFDPDAVETLDEATLHSGAGFSPWHGAELHGRVVRTISRGVTVYDGAEVVGDPGHGRFVARTTGAARHAG